MTKKDRELAEDIGWLMMYATPLSPVKRVWSVTVGNETFTLPVTGPGKISRLFYERGGGCVEGCAGCCRRDAWHPRLLWVGDMPPAEVTPFSAVRASISGHWVNVSYYDSTADHCDFLDDELRCTLYNKNRSTIGTLGPQVAASRRGEISWLTRRLPSRNWAWPKCPVPIAETKFSRELHIKTMDALGRLVAHVPADFRAAEGLTAVRNLGLRPNPLEEFDRLAKGYSLVDVEILIKGE